MGWRLRHRSVGASTFVLVILGALVLLTAMDTFNLLSGSPFTGFDEVVVGEGPTALVEERVAAPVPTPSAGKAILHPSDVPLDAGSTSGPGLRTLETELCAQILNMAKLDIPAELIEKVMSQHGTALSVQDLACVEERAPGSSVVEMLRLWAETEGLVLAPEGSLRSAP